MRIRKILTIILLLGILALALVIGTFISNTEKFKKDAIRNILGVAIEQAGLEDDSKGDPEESGKGSENENYIILTDSSGKQHTVIVEVADTAEKRALGLMNRKSLEKGHGMLFIHPFEEVQSFWMKDTLIPLDLIHINNGEIVEVIKNLQPCNAEKGDFYMCPTYPGSSVAKYSLEVNAGFVNEFGLKPGDNAEIILKK